jgi:hypothetical protein
MDVDVGEQQINTKDYNDMIKESFTIFAKNTEILQDVYTNCENDKVKKAISKGIEDLISQSENFGFITSVLSSSKSKQALAQPLLCLFNSIVLYIFSLYKEKAPLTDKAFA